MNDPVIHVDVEIATGDLLLQVIIYHGLEGCQRVHKAEKHYSQFEEPFTSLEGSLLLITFFDSDIVVAPLYIKFGVPLLSRQVVNKIGNEWEWVFVWYCPFVEVVVILYQSILAVLLLNEEESTSIQGLQSPDSL
jgi:hypothetical protein